MTFTTALITCFKKYVDYSGRASREEYWWFFGTMIGLYALALYVDSTPRLPLLVTVTFVVPWLAVSARRLHDLGYAGWFAFACLVPPPGLWLAYFFVKKGTPGPNQYGPEPL